MEIWFKPFHLFAASGGAQLRLALMLLQHARKTGTGACILDKNSPWGVSSIQANDGIPRFEDVESASKNVHYIMIVSVRCDHQDRRVTGLVINLHCRIDAKRDLVGPFRKALELGDWG